MKSREQILSEQTGISIHRINHETVRASDALDAMEEYAQLKVNELNKSDVIKSVCECCGSKNNHMQIVCEECRNKWEWKK